jgi:hypothetical protein
MGWGASSVVRRILLYIHPMLNETGERFLKAILERVPAERIVEIHLFPPIRQGQLETGVAVVAAEPAPALELQLQSPRLEVHTAWYRLTRKGPERGKWEIEVKTQADAPLETVETVVRGVQERAGEAIEPTRLTGRELIALMSEPAWQTSP